MSSAEIDACARQHTLSVVIVSWNSADVLAATLAAVAAGTPGDVTVVDNASHDGTVESIVRSFPTVHTIANTKNVGFACACNQGIRQSQGEYVLLLNPDCRPVSDACAQMVAYLGAHGEVAVVGPHIQRSDGTDDLRSPRRLPTLWSDFCDRSGLAEAWPRSRLFAAHHLPRFDRSATSSVECLSGACMMLRRSALVDIGLLDEDFFLFGEDADLCVRLRQAGWQVHYLGAASVVHQGGASTDQARDQVALYALASRQRFFRKHRGAVYAFLHRVVNAILAGARVTVLAPVAVAVPGLRVRLRRQWKLLQWCLSGATSPT